MNPTIDLNITKIISIIENMKIETITSTDEFFNEIIKLQINLKIKKRKKYR
jgi:hypothetical protein